MSDLGDEYAKLLKTLRLGRRALKAERKLSGNSRQVLTKRMWDVILRKTKGRCHICGGEIDGTWQACARTQWRR